MPESLWENKSEIEVLVEGKRNKAVTNKVTANEKRIIKYFKLIFYSLKKLNPIC